VAAPSDTKFQVNLKAGDALINLYAANPDELGREIEALESLAPVLAALDGTLKAAYATSHIAAPPAQQLGQPAGGWGQPGQGNIQPGGYAQHEQAQQGPPPAWAQQPAQSQAGFGGGPSCAHGAMVYKSGVSKTSGKPYSGHFCPSSNRADQCKPVFG
jgi:hypothetical protein